MASLILNRDTAAVNLVGNHLELRRFREGEGSEKTVFTIPCCEIDQVIVSGRPHVTIPVFQKLMDKNIPVYFLSERGRWLGSLEGQMPEMAARRMRQYQMAGEETVRCSVATAVVRNKICNCRRVLCRMAANRKMVQAGSILQICEDLTRMAGRLNQNSRDLNGIRGIEGAAAVRYFQGLALFFPAEFPFRERTRRPPMDPPNALMSYAYAVLLAEIRSALRLHGLDPDIGFLHDIENGRSSLALDLLEAFRAPVADVLAVKLLKRRFLKMADFRKDGKDGGVFLQENARAVFFRYYEEDMNRIFKDRNSGERISYRGAIRRQALAVVKILQEIPAKIELFAMS